MEDGTRSNNEPKEYGEQNKRYLSRLEETSMSLVASRFPEKLCESSPNRRKSFQNGSSTALTKNISLEAVMIHSKVTKAT